MEVYYFDESGIHAKSDVLGFGLLKPENPSELQASLKQILNKYHFNEEVNFWKVSSLRRKVYEDWIKAFLTGDTKMQVLLIEKGKPRREVGFLLQLCDLLLGAVRAVEEGAVTPNNKLAVKSRFPLLATESRPTGRFIPHPHPKIKNTTNSPDDRPSCS